MFYTIFKRFTEQETKSDIKFFSDYFSMTSEAKYKRIHEEGLAILTPKQTLQKLPIALAQVKRTKSYPSNNKLSVSEKNSDKERYVS